MPFQKKFGNFCNSRGFVNFKSLTLIIQGNQEGSMLQAPRLQEVQQNKGFESASSTPQGSHKGIPHTGGEPVPYVNVLPKHFSGQPDRTKEKKGKYKSL